MADVANFSPCYVFSRCRFCRKFDLAPTPRRGANLFTAAMWPIWPAFAVTQYFALPFLPDFGEVWEGSPSLWQV